MKEQEQKIIDAFILSINSVSNPTSENYENAKALESFSDFLDDSGIEADIAINALLSASEKEDFVITSDKESSKKVIEYIVDERLSLESDDKIEAILKLLGGSVGRQELAKSVSLIRDRELKDAISKITIKELKKVVGDKADNHVQELKSIIYSLANDSIKNEEIRELFLGDKNLDLKLGEFAKIANSITITNHFDDNGKFKPAPAGFLDCSYITVDNKIKSIQATKDTSGNIETHSLSRHPVAGYVLSAVLGEDGVSDTKVNAFYDRVIKESLGVERFKEAQSNYIKPNGFKKKDFKRHEFKSNKSIKLEEAMSQAHEKIWSDPVGFDVNSLELEELIVRFKTEITTKKDRPLIAKQLSNLERYYKRRQRFNTTQYKLKAITSYLTKSDNIPKALNIAKKIMNQDSHFEINQIDINADEMAEFKFDDETYQKFVENIDTLLYAWVSTPKDLNQKNDFVNPVDTQSEIEVRYATQVYTHLIESQIAIPSVTFEPGKNFQTFTADLYSHDPASRTVLELSNTKGYDHFDLNSAVDIIKDYPAFTARSLLSHSKSEITRGKFEEERDGAEKWDDKQITTIVEHFVTYVGRGLSDNALDGDDYYKFIDNLQLNEPNLFTEYRASNNETSNTLELMDMVDAVIDAYDGVLKANTVVWSNLTALSALFEKGFRDKQDKLNSMRVETDNKESPLLSDWVDKMAYASELGHMNSEQFNSHIGSKFNEEMGRYNALDEDDQEDYPVPSKRKVSNRILRTVLKNDELRSIFLSAYGESATPPVHSEYLEERVVAINKNRDKKINLDSVIDADSQLNKVTTQERFIGRSSGSSR